MMILPLFIGFLTIARWLATNLKLLDFFVVNLRYEAYEIKGEFNRGERLYRRGDPVFLKAVRVFFV